LKSKKFKIHLEMPGTEADNEGVGFIQKKISKILETRYDTDKVNE
jgi:hypothetical protein